MKIAICGDCVINTPSQHTIGLKLQKLLDDCEIRGINFEVPIDTDLSEPIHKSGPVLSQSAQTPEWLEHHGFNLITLANNHSLDYGEKGLQATIGAFNKSTLTGIGTYDTAYDVAIIKSGNETIGFLGLTHKEFGCVDCSTGSNHGMAMVTSPKVPVIISKIKHRIDRLYLLVHAGVEYTDAPLPEWRELYRSFIDLGADGVIASHPHVPQGWEIYNGSPIAYSLGNFAFEVAENRIPCDEWFNSYIAVINTKDNSISMNSLRYDLNSKCIDIDLSPERIQHTKYLNGLLESETCYNEYLLSLYNSLEKTFNIMLQLGGVKPFGKVTLLKNFVRSLFGKEKIQSDVVHFLNLFQCESHRWMMMKYLDQNFAVQIKVNE